jgi:hypothetical protein
MPLTWDQSKFDDALLDYMKVTDKTLTEVLNTKAYYIARKALWFTKKADSGDIDKQLGHLVSVTHSVGARMTSKKGLSLVSRTRSRNGKDYEAPYAALIINKRRGRKGQKGLYGAEMEQAIRDMLASRRRSIAFLKSGWIPAIRILESFAKDKSKAGVPPGNDGAVSRRDHGIAYVAQENAADKVVTIINAAHAQNDKKDALTLYGSRALQVAFDDEAASMEAHIAQKMSDPTDAANKKLA